MVPSLLIGQNSNVKIISKEQLCPVAGQVAVAYDKLMLVWGGYYVAGDNQERFNLPNELLVYDTVFEKWFSFTTTGKIPQENSGACAILVDTKLYVFGGFTEYTEPYATLYSLDLHTLIWTKIMPSTSLVPTVRHKFAGWYYKNKLYFFGGYGPSPHVVIQPGNQDGLPMQYLVSSQFVYDTSLNYHTSWNNQLISFNLATSAWELVQSFGDIPSARAAHSATFIPDTSKVVVFGGRLQNERMNDLAILDMASMIWTKIDTSFGPCGRSWHSAVAVDSKRILLFGGFSQDCIPLDDSWYFDIDQRIWTPLERKPIDEKRLWHTGVAINGSCYIFGGCKSNILAINCVRVFAKDLVVIPSTPKPLSEICLKYVNDNRKLYSKRITQLPGLLYEKLQFISSDKRLMSVKTPRDLLRF